MILGYATTPLGVVIFFSGLLGLLIIHLFGPKIAEKSREEMLTDNQLNAHLSQSWDNIILGNKVFFDRWKDRFEELFLKTEKASIESVKTKDWSVSLAGLVTNGLVLSSALLLAWLNQDKPGFVIAILVMLPRSLQIVAHIQIIQHYVAQLKNLNEKLSVTLESVNKPTPIDLSHLIKHDDVSIKLGNQQYRCKDISDLLDRHKCGRFTITGPNGAGKSTLLLEIKNKLNLSATYLPAKHELMLVRDRISLSSGEIIVTAMEDLQSKSCGILLLDEWDANLSPEK
jgi:ABC-type bacteriocin/lantibiotic exporter with double-glycine peptidase domain